MKKFLTLSGILILALVIHSVAAAGQYQIEMVIFAQQLPNTELFEQTQSQIHWPHTIVDESTFTQVSPEHRLLNGVYGALSRRAGYQPLLHVAWIQSIEANQTGAAVRLRGAHDTIDGFVRLQRGQFLKLIVDLEYQPSAHQYYHLYEKRRVKFNEMHYLDHPKFGAIAIVKPL